MIHPMGYYFFFNDRRENIALCDVSKSQIGIRELESSNETVSLIDGTLHGCCSVENKVAFVLDLSGCVVGVVILLISNSS